MPGLALPGIGTVIISAAIDSINPCAIGVMVLLVSTLIVTRNKWKLFQAGMLYITAVYTTYFLAGLGLMTGLHFIPISIAQYISITVASFVIWAGLVEVKDYFWYGKGFSLSIPPEYAKKIHDMVQNVSIPGLVALGAFVAMVELPCTGGPYLAITLLLSQAFSFEAIMLLAFYNVIFIMPLIVILAAVFFGANIADIKMWKQKHREKMRLAIGLLLIALGWMLMVIAGGFINLA